MIARPSDITRTSPATPDLASAESPMQRQILLWQQEILRRELLRRRSDDTRLPVDAAQPQGQVSE